MFRLSNRRLSGRGGLPKVSLLYGEELGGVLAVSGISLWSRMFKSLRTRAFVRYVKRYGIDALMDRLYEREKEGLQYHHPGELVGDYDRCQTEEEVLNLLEGSCQKGRSGL